MTLRLRGVAARRRGDVEGLFEERAVERIGLVEHRQHVQRAVHQDALERDLESRHESLDLDQVGRRIAQRPHIERRAGCGRDERPPRPDPAGSSARMTPRLPDSTSGLTTHGNGTSSRPPTSTPIDTVRDQGPGRPASRMRSRNSRLSRLARAPSTWCHGTPRRSATSAATTTGRSPTAMTPSSLRCPSGVEHGRTRRRFVVEAHRNRPVAPRIVEVIAAIGGQHELDAELGGRVVEAARLIARRRRAQQHAACRRDVRHRESVPS